MSAPKPHRLSWFAVWRWNRWTWVSILPLLPAAYLLTAGAVRACLDMTGVTQGNQDLMVAGDFYYAPARIVAEQWTWLREVHSWQFKQVGAIFFDSSTRPKNASAEKRSFKMR